MQVEVFSLQVSGGHRVVHSCKVMLTRSALDGEWELVVVQRLPQRLSDLLGGQDCVAL